MMRTSLIACLVVLGAAVYGAVLLGQLGPRSASAAQKSEPTAADTAHELAALQAHLAMVMADYHATNLWFAGRNSNWPLAKYYWKAVEDHIELSAESEASPENQAKMRKIAAAIKQSPTMQVAATIDKKDAREFGSAYRGLLVGCYDCHKAIGKPYLRPRMPARPSRSIINVDPNATWPE